MVLGGAHVDDRLIPELARVVPPVLSRKLTTAHTLRSQVVALTTNEREAILAALERPPERLGDLRNALRREVQWQPRRRV